MTELTDRQSLAARSSDPVAPVEARERALAIYVCVGILLLVPGLLASGRVGVESGPLSPWLGPLDRAMQDIAFGSTLRFWLGVAGATMMALLLFYPLRKIFGIGRWISVAAWFHIHVVFGLLGPILILYHCYFGTGSTPANVALFTTLTVALSGLFGHYVYTRLSADFHGERRRAHVHLQDALADLGPLDASPTKSRLIEDLAAFAAQAHGERGELSASFGLARPLRDRRRDLISRAVWLIDNQGPEQGWSPTCCRDTKGRVVRNLDMHFACLGRAARRSIYEWLAGFWRLLHLPLFYVTIIATGIHVWKVWNMDGTVPPAVLEASADIGEATAGLASPAVGISTNGAVAARPVAPAKPPETANPSPLVPPIARRPVTTRNETLAFPPAPKEPPPAAEQANGSGVKPLVQAPKPAVRSASPPATPVAAPAAHKAAEPPASLATPPADEWPDLLASAPLEPQPKPRLRSAGDAIADYLASGAGKASPPPAVGTLPSPPARRVAEPRSAPAPGRTDTTKAAAPPPAVSPPATPPPVKQAQAPRQPDSPVGGPPPPPPQALGGPPPIQSDPVVELARKTAQWDTGGKLDPASMRQRLAELKKDPAFDHGKTLFPLTGQHKQVTCESCHKTTLKDTPRQCIDCHRKDDVHRGRRPKCENCHVTTDWGTIRRK